MRRLQFPPRLMQAPGPGRRPARAAYALPTLFTAGNMFLGFVAVLKAFEGVVAGMANSAPHFELAAKMIGVAVVLDGLDGRIARMTNTTSEFGKEMDSLADVITFCLAPAVLAWAWGFHFMDSTGSNFVREHLLNAGYFCAFLYLLCGAARLARFNVQTNPIPKNPGRADRKYFVGVPTPAAAGLVASIVYASNSYPVQWWVISVLWMALLSALGFLMVCTWRYRSFKDLNLLRPRSPLTVILIGSFIYLIWNYSKPVLLVLAASYVASGVAVRFGGIIRRRLRRAEVAAT